MSRSDLDSPAPQERSWWLDEALASEKDVVACPPLVGRAEADVAIVGGGFTGLWTALALLDRKPDLKVTLLEAEICGAGASGKNGGKVHGYWYALGNLIPIFGENGALAIARAGTKAQDAIRAFATTGGRDLWWREGGNIRISTSASQDAKIGDYVAIAGRLGVPDTVVPLSPGELTGICSSPAFRGGAFFPECATVQPARLVRALRAEALKRGVRIHEMSPMISLSAGAPNRVTTAGGEVLAREVILATNVALASHPELAAHLTISSSFAVMTEPNPEQLAKIGWTGEQAFSDMRMFLQYFRKTPDGRVLMGTGAGPLGFGGQAKAPRLRYDAGAAQRAVRALDTLLPAFKQTGLVKTWGGPVDLSADRYPFFGTLPGRRVHYACGFSGHGVNPTYMAGQALASLALDDKDEWFTLPFCNRSVPKLPVEPFRYLGATAIRWAILECETADAEGRSPVRGAKLIASLPKRLGMRIGQR